MTEPQPTYRVSDLMTYASALVERARLAATLGKQFDGDRDLYEVLGYPQDIKFADYLGHYRREGIAKRIVNRPAQDTWRTQAKLLDGDKEKDTPFLTGWQALVEKKGVWRQLSAVDRLAGIGRYGVLLIGFTGDKKLKDPVENGSMKGWQDVLYLRAFHEGDVTIDEWDRNTASARFGLPEMYSIAMGDDNRKEQVHWTRIVHVAEDSFDDVYGTPRLEAVYNRLNDLEKVVGGSAEATWKLMRKGFVLDVKPEYEMDKEVEDNMLDQVEEFEHGLRRFMLTRGVTAQDLGSQVVDPKGLFEALIALIAGTTGIPQRILLGSERGDLASSQDEANWAAIVEARREQFAEPFLLRPFIDRMLLVGVLPPPAPGYSVRWESLFQLTDKEKADIAKILSEALKVLLDAGFAVEDAITFLGAVPHVVGFKLTADLRPPTAANQPQGNVENTEDGEPFSVLRSPDYRRASSPRYVRLTANERRTARAVAQEVTAAANILAEVLDAERE